ncbi:M17 leucyl aminopeptidase, putative [Plasmodium vivax]|uniref:Leucine aminopeptidase n=6 Tax=Plasmodium vivax TaxID=5855 RepID=AMPL_PLAVS|nr:leucine aminopeptidase, putative [Plasmodium vivax]A5K3U9.1 RecName: Full=Leucine aminopeptidase; Short=PvLAP; AltName: Full=M17 leucyl aminopeptidase; Short=Pv-M17; Flags: Precursor [Plasmodium vivax Sal-1]KMZ78900.1 leucine aminopeptidase [Plasmodium vivax India VII]KMZ87108.1 leucine aminopeptidase [Plasmodium vivax Brazil I]KMZ91746.1 leucine aminopeptidase [Plasmodium vivax Mauritania I]KMZ97770.1 leucine aminopeptidase [Plasmodium vivax North Korean]EDL46203.1 leucine aminopeptidase,|eukprot:XP_001615930.1 leucine aminopeptidase [Plasmodium vivax Sal-1]
MPLLRSSQHIKNTYWNIPKKSFRTGVPQFAESKKTRILHLHPLCKSASGVESPPFFDSQTFSSISNRKEFRKMATTVPQVVSLDPTTIPIDYHTPIDDLSIEVKDISAEACPADEGLIVFLLNSAPKHSSSGGSGGNGGSAGSSGNGEGGAQIKINSSVKDNTINEFLKEGNMENFTGKLGTSKSFYIANDQKKYVSLAYVGCGPANEETELEIRKVAYALVTLLHDSKHKKVSIIFEIKIEEALFRFFLEHLFYEYVTDERFKSADKSTETDFIKNLSLHIANADAYKGQIDKARVYFYGTYYAAQLIAAPSNYCNPVSLSNAAVELAQKVNLECKILDVKELEELKMGAYLSVGKGSMYPNKFIHLTYKGAQTGASQNEKKKIALIGKGITFDSGGYNLKAAPGSMIDLMKFDMSGCAAVLGCAYCIGTIKPDNVEVHFLSAVCENMVSKNSYRPGDIITASNGKTIEVGNTDAEGRLTLADALVYAEKLGVDYIVDIATLTGAMLYSLGTSYAGVFGNNDQLINKILSSSKTSNEPVWWLPIINEYRSSLNSKYADLNNISSSVKASSVVASLFLKEFIENTPWAHIDIAGVSWNFKARKPKGFGVRLLTEFVLNDAV